MRFVIVTGMSGAGKSTAMKMMEDMGFFCIDNLLYVFLRSVPERDMYPIYSKMCCHRKSLMTSAANADQIYSAHHAASII